MCGADCAGCMAERLKASLLDERLVDVVCGPDAYRDLPRLLSLVNDSALTAGTQVYSLY